MPVFSKLAFICLVVFVTLGEPGIARADVVWQGDFETGDIYQWSGRQMVSPDRIQVVESPLRQGFYAMQVELRQGDVISNGNRAELVYGSYDPEGTERWYRWSTLWPEDYPSYATWQVFTQWHHDGCCGSPPVEFYVYGENIRLGTNTPNGLTWWTTPLVRGQWHDFIFHVRWSSDPNYGFIELYYDWDLVLPLTYVATMQPGTRNYLKQGLYRNASIPDTAFIYHDGMVEGTVFADLWWAEDFL